jgi:hypothetical protein
MADIEDHRNRVQRHPLQGVWNIVRFNYEFFIVAMLVVMSSGYLGVEAASPLISILGLLVATGTILSTFVSLGVSWYIYDASPLYSLTWLDPLLPTLTGAALNIHAGFDETSALLQQRYSGFSIDIIDFYDPAHHTERSIRRARRTYPPFPGTRTASSMNLELPTNYYQVVFLILAVHEIRNEAERITFFSQLKSSLVADGKVIVVEHARDMANFFAYTIGFFHFLPVRQLINDFTAAGLRITHQARLTPWIRVYSLECS